MIEVERGIHLFAEAGAGIVGDPHVLLFKDDVELGTHHIVRQHEAGHAVGFQRHHLLEVFARHALEEAGVVAGGEGIFLTADFGDRLRERFVRILLGALEHQVFEEMGQAGFSRRLVGAADLVPDHMGHDRRPMIRDDDQLKSVRQVKWTEIRAARHGAAIAAPESAIAGRAAAKIELFGQAMTPPRRPSLP